MGQILTRLDSTQLVSGQVDKIIVAFGLTEEWSGMSIAARFCKDLQSEIYDIELSSNYEVEIPHEVMDSAGTFQMSLRGEKDDRVITSNAVSYTVLDTILGVGVSSEPTETIYDKIANSQEINAALNAAIDAKQNAKTSEINAKSSENAANSSAQNAADSANAAKNYAAATYASAGNVLTKTVSGQFVHAEDAFEGGQIRGFKIKGQFKQNTTTGKNLLDPECLMDRPGIYFLDDEYNVVVKALDGISWSSITRTLSLSAGTYTFSVGNNQSIEYIVNGSEDFKSINSSQVITFDSDVELFIKLTLLSNSYPDTMKCQIEKGSMATEYEPYTGGKPSPSPDYPQKISVVENLEVPVYGANIFNLNKLRRKNGQDGYKVVDLNSGIIRSYDKNSDDRNWADINSCDYIFDVPREEKVHFIIDIVEPSDNSGSRLAIIDDKARYKYWSELFKAEGKLEFDVTVNKGYFLTFKLYDAAIKMSFYIKDTTYSESFLWSTANITLPTEHPFLASLPDGTHDELIVDNGGNVKLLARVGKVDLKQIAYDLYIENNARYGISSEQIRARSLDSNSLSAMCKELIPNGGDDTWLGRNEYSVSLRDYRNDNAGISFTLDKNPTIEKFNSFISNYESFDVFYRLNDFVEYSLNSLDLPLQPDSILNIWVLDEDNKDLIPEIEVTYERDLNAVIAKLESPQE